MHFPSTSVRDLFGKSVVKDVLRLIVVTSREQNEKLLSLLENICSEKINFTKAEILQAKLLWG